jgi:beta-propeller repeat-containing protein
MKRIFRPNSRNFFLTLGLLLVASAWGGATLSRSQQTAHQIKPDAATKARVNEAYGQLPLSFEANDGQTDPAVDFISRGNGYTLFLTPRAAVIALPATVLRMKFVGSETKARAAGENELAGKVNYLTGKDPKQWRTGISTYAKVVYQNLYPGVDLVYYGNQRQLEYDFVVGPGTDPNIIALSFEGADQVTVDAQGELLLRANGSEIRQRKPLIYQEVDGVRHEVAGNYKLRDRNTVGFQLGNYDASRPLVIDPVLVYSTFLGSSADDVGWDIAVDAAGNAYVVGHTEQLTTPSVFPTTVGAFDTTHNGDQDVFVTKLNASGSALIYSTFIGGNNIDLARGLEIDAAGNAYLTGITTSTDFPTTPGAFDTIHNGGFFDAFVAKLNPTGSALIYSTFLGSPASDVSTGLAIDAAGNAYVTGSTSGSGFPTTVGAFDTTPNGALDLYVTKLNASGTALIYSTLLGGGDDEAEARIEVDASGNAYLGGNTFSADYPTTVGAFDTTHNGSFNVFTRPDAFITKLNPTGSALVYSTFLGGDSSDFARDLAIDSTGNVYVTGSTASTDFPTTVGAFDTTRHDPGGSDIFVTKLNSTGSALIYSTLLGGEAFEETRAIDVDSAGNAYITGATGSADFPTTPDAFDRTYNISGDAFVTVLNPTASALIYSTFVGELRSDLGNGIDVDASGSIYVTGQTTSANFPTTVGAFDTTHNGSTDPFNNGFDAFVLKFSPTTGVPATVTLNPPSATNPVDSQHCVTATVKDASGVVVANVVVRFAVSGSVNTSGSATTDSNGEATFCYFGPPLPGADTITAFADTDGNSVQDSGEPIGVAEKTWVVPPSTPLCEVTNGGWIVAENGDRATFGGSARANESGATQGQEEYFDHGPAQSLKMNSINVLAVVCDGSTRASIFGQATVAGGLFNFRINVQDVGGAGKGQDTYQVLVNGYNSGEQILGGGNVEIRRK